MTRKEFIEKWKWECQGTIITNKAPELASDLDQLLKERAVEFGAEIATDRLGDPVPIQIIAGFYDNYIKEQSNKEILNPDIDDEAFNPRGNLLPNPKPNKP